LIFITSSIPFIYSNKLHFWAKPACIRSSNAHPFASTAFLLGVALCTPAQDSQTQIRAAVQAIPTRQQDAWNQPDLEAFMSGYWNSPDLTFFSGANAITGWEPTLEQYRKRYQSEGHQMGQFQFSEVQITRIAPDAVFEAYGSRP
jgi:hypothetical protein